MSWLGETSHCNFCYYYYFLKGENGSIFHFLYDVKGLVQERFYVFEIEFDA